MSPACPFCGFPVESDSHVFNVHCALSNAENDQLEAEVREAMQQPMEPVDFDRAMEIVRDVLALARFNRDTRGI